MAKTLTSTFDTSAQGWTMSGDVASDGWKSSGGDPGGYFSWVDAASGQDSYYNAPKLYLGNKGLWDGGTLSYDILDTGANYTAYDVQLVGDGHTLQFTSKRDAHFPTPNKWSAAVVNLRPGLFIDTATNAAPTAAEFRAVLRDLTSLSIRAEYVSGDESGGIDNVSLSPKPPPASDTRLIQAAAGFGGDHAALADHRFPAATSAGLSMFAVGAHSRGQLV